MTHQQRFERTWRALGADASLAAEAFADLTQRYAEPQRHYHTLVHVVACLDAFDALREAAKRPSHIEMALWFHDAVYDPERHDNEAQSAACAQDWLHRAGRDAETVKHVRELVLCTATHDEGLAGDAALMSDADLSIFGASQEDFEQYERDVRKEYAAVPDDVFRAARSAVLTRFAARERIYRSERGFVLWEERARVNLARGTVAGPGSSVV